MNSRHGKTTTHFLWVAFNWAGGYLFGEYGMGEIPPMHHRLSWCVYRWRSNYPSMAANMIIRAGNMMLETSFDVEAKNGQSLRFFWWLMPNHLEGSWRNMRVFWTSRCRFLRCSILFGMYESLPNLPRIRCNEQNSRLDQICFIGLYSGLRGLHNSSWSLVCSKYWSDPITMIDDSMIIMLKPAQGEYNWQRMWGLKVKWCPIIDFACFLRTVAKDKSWNNLVYSLDILWYFMMSVSYLDIVHIWSSQKVHFVVQGYPESQITMPDHPCMVYLPTFGSFMA